MNYLNQNTKKKASDSCGFTFGTKAGPQLILPQNVSAWCFSATRKNELWVWRETMTGYSTCIHN